MVTLTPSIDNSATHYRWIFNHGANGETDWINAEDQQPYVYGPIVDEEYSFTVTLCVMNNTDTGSKTKTVTMPDYRNNELFDIQQNNASDTGSVAEDVGRFHNIIEEWNLDDVVGGWLNEDPVSKVFCIFMFLVILFLLVQVFARKKRVDVVFVKKDNHGRKTK